MEFNINIKVNGNEFNEFIQLDEQLHQTILCLLEEADCEEVDEILDLAYKARAGQ